MNVCCIFWNLFVIPPNANAHRSVTTCHSNTHAMTFINYSLDVIETDVRINGPEVLTICQELWTLFEVHIFRGGIVRYFTLIAWHISKNRTKHISILAIFIKIYLPCKDNTSIWDVKQIQKAHAWVRSAYL